MHDRIRDKLACQQRRGIDEVSIAKNRRLTPHEPAGHADAGCIARQYRPNIHTLENTDSSPAIPGTAVAARSCFFRETERMSDRTGKVGPVSPSDRTKQTESRNRQCRTYRKVTQG